MCWVAAAQGICEISTYLVTTTKIWNRTHFPIDQGKQLHLVISKTSRVNVRVCDISAICEEVDSGRQECKKEKEMIFKWSAVGW